MQIERTPFADAELDVRYGQVTEARRDHQDAIRSWQEAVDEIEPLLVCQRLALSVGLRVANTHGRPDDDSARRIVSHAADSAPIRLRLEKTWRLEKTHQDKQNREQLLV